MIDAVPALLPLLAGALMLALGGLLHCAGMCGGIGAALTFTIPARRRQGGRLWLWQGLFATGRVAAYGVLGALAGALGGALLGRLPGGGPAWPALFSGLLMALLAAHFLGHGALLRRLERPGARLWRRLKPLSDRLLPVDRPHKAVALGALWGLLPCGLVYSALLLAATTGGAGGGALVMLVFGAVTVAPVALAGVAGGRLGGRGRDHRRWAGAASLALAAWFLAQGLWGGHGPLPLPFC
ncbi:sulfite exporter TauE/SafE family protein [Alcanivorax marinus]|uniref:Sulfite exporter TauE/SafE family protein n=1 Tax=Alloalcanivorax marinus TaxID=1177169 RepID=A0A9Q3UQX1_9GAMM|nr:sulfite exporter TauE/SafE family protein [Alloalcanivorax marinus]MCC4309954.1 sulfite exporter TauE/SafE family protein [Alloalcanivorax marinus]